MAKLIEHCWKTEHEGRPTFGGAEGVVATLTNIEARMLKKDDDATVETLSYSPAALAFPVSLPQLQS